MSDSKIDSYADAMERGKTLKKAELPGIPDEWLLDVVMHWIWNKDYDDNQYEAIARSLPKPCRNVFCCQLVTSDVENGGLHQLFGNSMAKLAEMSVEGFLELGSPRVSQVMTKALELYQQYDIATVVEIKNQNSRPDLYGKIIPYGSGYDDPVVRRYYEQHRNIFDELDTTFYDEYESVDYVKYIRQNAEYFGE